MRLPNSRIWFTTLTMFGSPTPSTDMWPMPARMPPPPAPEDMRKPAAMHQPKARTRLGSAIAARVPFARARAQLAPERAELRRECPQDESGGERHQRAALRPGEENRQVVVVVRERGHEVARSEERRVG